MFDSAGSRFACVDTSSLADWQETPRETAGNGACTECNCPRFISGGHDNICQLATCKHFYKAHQ
jgi:hypothetical protein